MATIREISNLTGFSIATVSKVLNGVPGVGTEKIELIMAAAKKLNYRPNLNARHLKTGTSKTLGIIVEDITVFNTPQIIDGIGVCCDNHNYHYILSNLRFDKQFGHHEEYALQKEELVNEMIDEMLSKQVDGIVYVGCHSHNISLLSKRQDTKFVCAYCFSDDPSIPSVIYDDCGAAYNATKLLIDKGHRKIGVLAGKKDSLHTSSRLEGFQESLFDNSIPYNPRFTFYGDWNRDSGYELAHKLLEEGVTAIFAHNDLMAMGVVDYCSQQKIEIGKDLALIGFDNNEITSVCRPTLSTVSLPLFDIGHVATETMFQMIDKKSLPENHITKLACSIIERESTL